MTTAGDDRTGPVLVVEDDPAAIRLIEESFEEMERPVDYVVVTDGVEAFDFLHRRGDHADAPRPSLVLLDLGLPAKNGQQVLTEIREDPALRLLPVVVLSARDDAETVAECYANGANAYITKPEDYELLLDKLETLVEFWGRTTEPPPPPRTC
jgi:CheY-like chemotaxis protein